MQNIDDQDKTHGEFQLKNVWRCLRSCQSNCWHIYIYLNINWRCIL